MSTSKARKPATAVIAQGKGSAASVTAAVAQAAAVAASAAPAVPATSVAPTPAAPAVAPAPLVLVAVTTPGTPRQGTARAAALAALLANIGQPRQTVLQAVAASETAWHQAAGRTPKGIAPAGWLKLFGASFGPAQAAQ